MGGDYCKKIKAPELVTKIFGGVPMNPVFLHSLGAYQLTMMYDGRMGKIIAKYPPATSKCPAQVFKIAGGLKPHHLSGILAVVGVCCIAGIILHMLLPKV